MTKQSKRRRTQKERKTEDNLLQAKQSNSMETENWETGPIEMTEAVVAAQKDKKKAKRSRVKVASMDESSDIWKFDTKALLEANEKQNEVDVDSKSATTATKRGPNSVASTSVFSSGYPMKKIKIRTMSRKAKHRKERKVEKAFSRMDQGKKKKVREAVKKAEKLKLKNT
mmetsp:Transcript_16610/g.27452  ORF Transcript_16610/g.27452 Transcript_16610/m.27452 type:complete len:170 (-) Transcript_16610:542-1051(-)|eukprot:CAMPEP_0184645930 /NCGR_PEP_ID=MMETSP0308-20130426/2547_1 /TAXON_ID=38269 /ORGANISM="Gloeochaete witrockiana, Strain SAG 46.84" /LENGTH=169 /DNA_ID=CAMNT_0027075465 /DNA_START=164 /DNA_END=673 /DNA_ORIENTATION=+